MDAEISSARKSKPNGFITLLSSAVCEWFLMFLLFVDAALSYLLIKFARYCELQTPCLLCSRLDNGFGEKKPGFYWSLLCTNHREEITSLVSCSIHGKFADVHSMCGECLTPIAMGEKKSNPESYRLLIGKSWVDVDRSVLQNLMLNKQMRYSPDVRTCSCCSSIWRAKSKAERLLEVKHPIGFGASKANVKPPLPRAPGSSRFSRRDGLKRLRDKFTGPMTQHQAGRSTAVSGKMSHVGYTKLKISSESESEFPFSEDDDDGASTDYSQCNRRRQKKAPAESDSEKRMHRSPEVKPSTSYQLNMHDVSLPKNVNPLSSNALVEHDVRENDRAESCKRPGPSVTPELVSLSGLQSPDVAEDDFDASAETSSPLHMPVISLLSELLSLCSVPPISSDLTIPNQSNNDKKDDTSEVNHIETAEGTLSDDAHFKTLQVDASAWLDTNSGHSDRYALKPVNTCDSAKLEEDSAQVSTSKLGSSSKETTVTDTEVESIINELKRQIENDRNSLNSLYKELEEERNAAASAANEAMAMITRLQEEKAALHMEALQYLRMMEEQAEYDVEALERANDLLAERDKELQDLEYELEFYRDNFPNKLDVKETSSPDNRVVAETSPDAPRLPNGNCKPVSVSNIQDEN
ncbi:hypothetical protein ACS0TY_007403 [Phlomoides rotata]